MSVQKRSLSVAALFAGIGGIELGLENSGHQTELLCEWDQHAQLVLSERFSQVRLHSDVQTLNRLPKVDLVTGGFPCQDISLAGTRAGLAGSRSGLVGEFFRLIEKPKPEFILLENVSNILRLNKGANLIQVLRWLEEAGYRWAYRLVDTRGFGLPQRRLRVFILGSRGPINPEDVLFSQSCIPKIDDSIGPMTRSHHYGFYWTEGKRGVGWANDSVPTIKGGSGLGIPSPPAIFNPRTKRAFTPHINDAERLQGFPSGWTEVMPEGQETKAGHRWKMVGNAVSVPAAEWIGAELATADGSCRCFDQMSWDGGSPLPTAAFGSTNSWHRAAVSTHPLLSTHVPISKFLEHATKPLSTRALNGYVSRAMAGDKKFPEGFIEALAHQAQNG